MKAWLKNKKNLHFFKGSLLLLFFLFLFLPRPAFAVLDVLTTILGGGLAVGLHLSIVPLAIVLLISVGLTKITGWLLLDVVIDPAFLKDIGYTTNNPFVDIGLSITQEFVNLFLVVALVYIAVSIALRLANEAQAKKMLFWLIFIALIVNFAPVICGIIVDASNILMNYFFKGIEEGVSGILIAATNPGSNILSDLLNLVSLKAALSVFTRTIMQIILNLSVSLIFLIFAGIFLFRYLMIWVLVILAPLAFVSVIIPQTKVLIWDRWWNKFIEWCFIGVPAAFFLYLGAKLFELIPTMKITEYISAETAGIERDLVEYSLIILPYVVIVAFFYIGFVTTLSASRKGTQSLLSLLKAAPQKIKPAARQVSNIVRGVPEVQRAEEKVRTKLETTPLLGRIVGGPGAFEREKRKEFEAAYKSLEGISVPSLEKRLSQPVTSRKQRFERAAAIQRLLEKEAFDEQKHGKYVAEALSLGLKKSDFYKRRPDLAKTFLNMRIKDAMRNILPSEVAKVDPKAFRNFDVAVHVALDDAKYEKLAKEGSTEAKENFKSTFLRKSLVSGEKLDQKLEEIITKMTNDPRFP